eukprot:TRINITY_DN3601_c0_g1_i2.p1 TRINITY_DN3601_c0_g1~~TRINITY_DN3601_c0_g1_i2.p1  ORF type:complete len:532 (+),score=139.89 TRINITY_DN3601_c0_g1_i2:66-1598(+)
MKLLGKRRRTEAHDCGGFVQLPEEGEEAAAAEPQPSLGVATAAAADAALHNRTSPLSPPTNQSPASPLPFALTAAIPAVQETVQFRCVAALPVLNLAHCDITAECALAVTVLKGVRAEDDHWAAFRRNHFQLGLTYELAKTVPDNTAAFVLVDQQVYPILQLHADVWISTDNLQTTDKLQFLMQPKDHRVVPFTPVSIVQGSPVTFPTLIFPRATRHPGGERFTVVAAVFATYGDGHVQLLRACASEPLVVHGAHPGKLVRNRAIATQPPAPPPPTQEQHTHSGDTSCGWIPTLDGGVARAGPVGINIAGGTEALTVGGNALVTGNVLHTSDARVKSNFHEVNTNDLLERFSLIKVYDYTRKDSGAAERGVIAQEVSRLFPATVVETKTTVTLESGERVENVKTVDQGSLLIQNVGATVELTHRVETLSTKVCELDGQVVVLVHSIDAVTAVRSEPSFRTQLVAFARRHARLLLLCTALLVLVLLAGTSTAIAVAVRDERAERAESDDAV